MSEKPSVLVTRKLPDAVEARLARDYRARFNPEDRLYTTAELLAEAGRAKRPLDFASGEDMARIVTESMIMPDDIRGLFVRAVMGEL